MNFARISVFLFYSSDGLETERKRLFASSAHNTMQWQAQAVPQLQVAVGVKAEYLSSRHETSRLDFEAEKKTSSTWSYPPSFLNRLYHITSLSSCFEYI